MHSIHTIPQSDKLVVLISKWHRSAYYSGGVTYACDSAYSAGGAATYVSSSLFTYCHVSYTSGPIEAWNKTNSIKDLRFLQHCKFTLRSSGL